MFCLVWWDKCFGGFTLLWLESKQGSFGQALHSGSSGTGWRQKTLFSTGKLWWLIWTHPLGLFELCLCFKYSASTNDNLWWNTWVCNVFWSKPHLPPGTHHGTETTWNHGVVTRYLVVSYTSDLVLGSTGIICTVSSDSLGTDKLSSRYAALQVGGEEKKICLL